MQFPPSAGAVSAEAYALRYTLNFLGQFERQSVSPYHPISRALRWTSKKAGVHNPQFANIHQCRINRLGPKSRLLPVMVSERDVYRTFLGMPYPRMPHHREVITIYNAAFDLGGNEFIPPTGRKVFAQSHQPSLYLVEISHVMAMCGQKFFSVHN